VRAAYAASWNDSKKGRAARAVVAALVALTALAGPARGAGEALGDMISVIVRGTPGAGIAPEQAVESYGGRVGRRIGIIGGFVAEVPEQALPQIGRAPGVLSVTPNGRVHMLGMVDGYDAATDANSIYNTTLMTGAQEYWKAGFTGKGVDVAVIDSGIAPVEGMTVPGRVLNGPDLSFESQSSTLRYMDTFGHGTHMAGIIGGRDSAAVPGQYAGDSDHFVGMAPDARIVSVKVADAHGATDVSQIIAAIDWVVQNRNRNGLNIRVLNLSFGTDGTQSYVLDPLAYAVEVAWQKGIVVVAAAGNAGWKPGDGLANPAYDPFVIAVGAVDPLGTLSLADDIVAPFSSSGDGVRKPDLAAPGKSVPSLRVPGSMIDQQHPGGRVNSRLFRGSGTSQAAAVVSGAAALVLQQRPTLSPDQVKGLLMGSAAKLAGSIQSTGSGELSLDGALHAGSVSVRAQKFKPSTGLGSLDAARGSVRLIRDGVTLSGEVDIFGKPFVSATWALLASLGMSWSGGTWNGSSWSGSSWSGSSWSGMSWSGSSWSGTSWSGSSWSGMSWSGVSWSGSSWSGTSWSSNDWTGASWSGSSWSGASWSGASWSGASWS